MTIRISAAEARAMLAKPAKRGRFPRASRIDRTCDGIVFASRKEMLRYAALKQMERAGIITHLVLQPKFEIRIEGEKLCDYTADFSYFRDGDRIVEDVKSTGTAADKSYRIRKRAAEIAYHFKVTEYV